jgi:hypothetical protein
MNPFKGKIAFIRKSTRIMKSTGRIEFAQKSKTIPNTKRFALLL